LELDEVPVISDIKELTKGIFDSTMPKPENKDVKEFSLIIKIIQSS
jgi:hypothetical protein